MLTLKLLREQPDFVIERLAVKNFDASQIVKDILEADSLRRASQTKLDSTLAEQNQKAKEIGMLMKQGNKEEAENVIIATGGVSYPGTGSTGDGYIFADRLGHTIEEVRPSLTPLRTSHPQRKFLDGLLLKNVNAKLYVEDEMVREEFGELSFSDRGIEGAVAL